jgi:NAD(P)H dehydrogenase (quinone)
MSIVVTGATGNLGGLAVDALLRRGAEPDSVIAVGRNTERLELRAERGVRTVAIDYQDRDSLQSAFEGAEKLLLVSGSDIGQRVEQHRNVVESAARAGVELLVYTSILRADSATQLLAGEHQATEELLSSSGIPHVLLRNGWYFENYTSQIPSYLENGAIVGAAGEGRISGASREDYAEAAAAVLTSSDQAGAVYELGGDQAFTMAELAAELSRQTRRDIAYRNLGVDDYAELLASFGLPEPAARTYADGDRAVADGELYVETGDLSRLIGRSTTPLSEAISAALAPAEVTR